MTSPAARAFTIVELLTVIAIVSVLISVSVWGSGSFMRNIYLGEGMHDLVAELGRGRQAAISDNHDVEIRFYLTTDAEAKTSVYRSFQLFEYDDTGSAHPLDKVHWLPTGIVLNGNATVSPLLAPEQRKVWSGASDTKPSIPGFGFDYDACSFRFRAGGGTDLTAATAQCFVTLQSRNDGADRPDLPANYATVQVDPGNGTVRSYRP